MPFYLSLTGIESRITADVSQWPKQLEEGTGDHDHKELDLQSITISDWHWEIVDAPMRKLQRSEQSPPKILSAISNLS